MLGEAAAIARAALPPHLDSELTGIVLANMFAGVSVTRASDAVILLANAQFASMFGYELGELEGKPVSILNAPADESPEEVARQIIADLRTKGAWSGEIQNIKKDGTHFWSQASVMAINHPRYGQVWVTVQMDITARKQAVEQLRRSEERLALVLESTGGGAWDWDIKSGEVYLSPYWIASLGYSPDEVHPHISFWESIVHPDDLPRVGQAMAEHLEQHTASYECVNRLRRKDGTWRWNLDRGRVVERGPRGEPLRMVGTDTDLSEQRWSGLKEWIVICASCKMIRAETGDWRALESHFGEHSLAQFSHGICPACINKYYADLELQDLPG